MTTSLTKYVAAAAVAGAVAFGGYTIAGAQDAPSTTTTPPSEQQAPPSGERPDGAQPGGERQGNCDHDKGQAGGGSAESPDTSGTAPGTSSSSSSSNTETSFTST